VPLASPLRVFSQRRRKECKERKRKRMQRKEEKKRTKFSLEKVTEGRYENSVAEMAKTLC